MLHNVTIRGPSDRLIQSFLRDRYSLNSSLHNRAILYTQTIQSLCIIAPSHGIKISLSFKKQLFSKIFLPFVLFLIMCVFCKLLNLFLLIPTAKNLTLVFGKIKNIGIERNWNQKFVFYYVVFAKRTWVTSWLLIIACHTNC